MSGYSTLVRATHLVTNAAWFGGSLMGAVALNPASREGDDAHEQAEIADEGWSRWGRVQGASIGLHLVSGLAIVADNRRRVVAHTPTTVANRMRWLQWATPVTTAGILVLDAYLGEQQRGAAGLLDPPTRLRSRTA